MKTTTQTTREPTFVHRAVMKASTGSARAAESHRTAPFVQQRSSIARATRASAKRNAPAPRRRCLTDAIGVRLQVRSRHSKQTRRPWQSRKRQATHPSANRKAGPMRRPTVRQACPADLGRRNGWTAPPRSMQTMCAGAEAKACVLRPKARSKGNPRPPHHLLARSWLPTTRPPLLE